jgi:SH3 domain protein
VLSGSDVAALEEAPGAEEAASGSQEAAPAAEQAIPGSVAAPTAWVTGRLRIYVRRGPTDEYKVIGTVSDGDRIAVLERRDDKAHVQVEGGLTGWIDASYVSEEPPSFVRAGQLEVEVSNLRERLERTDKETSRLLDENLSLTARDSEQRERIAKLSAEGLALRSQARWREWLAGASILGVGILGGAILHRTAVRRRSSRIRL